MGNCVALSRPSRRVSCDLFEDEEEVLRVVKVDGKVLEYKASVLVRDLLPIFDGFGVGVSRGTCRVLPPEHELKVGRVYYLLPLVKDAKEEDNSCQTIKLVLTKQQLQELLCDKSLPEEVLCGLQKQQEESVCTAAGWKPKLETILEELE